MSYEDAKAERDFRQNPPSTAPGQGDGLDWNNMPTGSSSVESVSDSYQSDINSTLNNMNGTTSQQGSNQQQNNSQMQQMYQPKSVEDRIFDIAELGGKGIWAYLKALVNSLRNNSKADWHYLGEQIIKFSGAVFVIGIIGCIIELFTQKGNTPIEMLIGSTMSTIIGVIFISVFPSGKSVSDNSVVEEQVPDVDWGSELNDYNFDMDNSDYPDTTNDYYEEEEEDWDAMLSALDEMETSNANSISSGTFDTESAINSLPEIQVGTHTRQYLFEAFSKVLPTCTPGYATMQEIYSDTDEFYNFEIMMRNAASQVGMKEENLPELTRLYEKAPAPVAAVAVQ